MHPWTFLPKERNRSVGSWLRRVSLRESLPLAPFFGARPVEVCLAIIIDVAVQFCPPPSSGGEELCPAVSERATLWLGCDERVYVSALQTTLV